MSWLRYDFACPCGHVYTDLVQGADGRPDPCPECQGTEAVRQLSTPMVMTKTIPVYPGYQRMTAGGGHEARRPAEKAGRQISMHGASSHSKATTST